jgi:hypothetical protein
MTPFDTFIMLVGVILAFFSMSFAFVGETYFFALSESIFIGGGITLAAYAIIKSLSSSLTGGHLSLFIPLIIGLLAFTRWTKYRWLARYPISVLSGVGLGVVVGQMIEGQIVNAISVTINDLSGVNPISALIQLIGVITTVFYFTYSSRFSKPVHEGTLGFISRMGRIFLFAGFGYLYASTFITEGIDSLTSALIILVLRTVRALQGFPGMG